MIVLTTARLNFRQFTPEDVDRLVELDSDPEVMRYISYGLPTSRERYVDDVLPYWLEYHRQTPMLGYWAAEDRRDGRFHGWFHLRPDRMDAGEQELGYRLRRASWRQGYASEGAAALIEHGFVRVGTDKISARTLVGNLGSRAVMEKCGLRHETDFEFPEDVIAGRSAAERAAVKYSITRARWAAARP